MMILYHSIIRCQSFVLFFDFPIFNQQSSMHTFHNHALLFCSSYTYFNTYSNTYLINKDTIIAITIAVNMVFTNLLPLAMAI